MLRLKSVRGNLLSSIVCVIARLCVHVEREDLESLLRVSRAKMVCFFLRKQLVAPEEWKTDEMRAVPSHFDHLQRDFGNCSRGRSRIWKMEGECLFQTKAASTIVLMMGVSCDIFLLLLEMRKKRSDGNNHHLPSFRFTQALLKSFHVAPLFLSFYSS